MRKFLFRASEYPALPWAGMNEARKKPFSARKLRPSMGGEVLLLSVFLTAILAVATPSFAQSATLVATVRPNPLKVEISAPSSVAVGQWFEISANISNLGGETIDQTVAVLHSPSEIKVKSQRKKLGSLSAHETIPLNWQAKANASGNFFVLVEVTGKLAGEAISDSDSQEIIATGTLGARLLRLIFGG